MGTRLLFPLTVLALSGSLVTGGGPAASVTSPVLKPSEQADIADVADTHDAVQRADALIDTALAYLRTRQQPDGSWQRPQDPPAITALVLRAFVAEPEFTPDSDFLARGYERLLANQVGSGGIYRDLLANYNTAVAVSALAAGNLEAGDGRFDEPIARAVAYLRGLQWTEETRPEFDDETRGRQVVRGPEDPFYGGWGYGGRSRGPGRPDLSNLHLTLDALREAGVPPEDPAFQRAVAFVTRLQNSSETNDQAWAGDDGGFVYSPSADRRGESMAGEYATATGERRLRSYGSMTYAGFKSLIYAGLTRDDPRVAAAWDWIRSNWTLAENPGMASGDPAKARDGYYYYLHALAKTLNAADIATIDTPDGTRHDWRVELTDQLAALQQPDGAWVGVQRWYEDNPVLVTGYAVLALQEARESLRRDGDAVRRDEASDAPAGDR